jgi:hypothetical protein
MRTSTPRRLRNVLGLLLAAACSRGADAPAAAPTAPAAAPSPAPSPSPTGLAKLPDAHTTFVTEVLVEGPGGKRTVWRDPASAPTAPGPTPTAAPTDPPAVSGLPLLQEAVALDPTGAAGPLDRTGETTVDPAATFRVQLSAPCRDARLELLDASDALLPAASTREVVAGATKLTLAPSAPLAPGAHLQLRLDGAVTREWHDATGRAFHPLVLKLVVAGAPPPPEPSDTPRARRRKR